MLISEMAPLVLQGFSVSDAAERGISLAGAVNGRLDELSENLGAALRVARGDKGATKGAALLLAEQAQRDLAQIANTARRLIGPNREVLVSGTEIYLGDFWAVHRRAERLLGFSRKAATAIREHIRAGNLSTLRRLVDELGTLGGSAGLALLIAGASTCLLRFALAEPQREAIEVS